MNTLTRRGMLTGLVAHGLGWFGAMPARTDGERQKTATSERSWTFRYDHWAAVEGLASATYVYEGQTLDEL